MITGWARRWSWNFFRLADGGLADHLVARAKAHVLPPATLTFDYAAYDGVLGDVARLRRQSRDRDRGASRSDGATAGWLNSGTRVGMRDEPRPRYGQWDGIGPREMRHHSAAHFPKAIRALISRQKKTAPIPMAALWLPERKQTRQKGSFMRVYTIRPYRDTARPFPHPITRPCNAVPGAWS